jgi:hypothetical protein
MLATVSPVFLPFLHENLLDPRGFWAGSCSEFPYQEDPRRTPVQDLSLTGPEPLSAGSSRRRSLTKTEKIDFGRTGYVSNLCLPYIFPGNGFQYLIMFRDDLLIPGDR